MNEASEQLAAAIEALFASHEDGPERPYVDAPSGRLWYVTLAVAGSSAAEVSEMLLEDCRQLAERFAGCRLYWRIRPLVTSVRGHVEARTRLAIDHAAFAAEKCGFLCSTFKPELSPMLDLREVRREIARSMALP